MLIKLSRDGEKLVDYMAKNIPNHKGKSGKRKQKNVAEENNDQDDDNEEDN